MAAACQEKAEMLEAAKHELADAQKTASSVPSLQAQLSHAQHTIMALTGEIRAKTQQADESKRAVRLHHC